MERKQKYNLCDETPADCHFELKTFPKGATGCNEDANISYLIYCQTGHVRISSTLFHDEILHEGEIMFVPRQSECTGTGTGTALSDATYSSINSITPSAAPRSASSRTSTPTGI